ncbi:MAG: HipA domain-containing protein [Candidatus Berkiella sp.]
MKYCPITYEAIPQNQDYSAKGLKLISPKLTHLAPLPFTTKELQNEAVARADKMSIQGVQPKLSAIINIKQQSFEIVDRGGVYIIKPQSIFYEQTPQNEDVTMRMAKAVGIDVPLHGLIYAKDGELNYFIKRFDRGPRKQKFAMEDFAQLSGLTRDTKYRYSMEKLIPLIEKYTTFPMLEKSELFLRMIFNYIVANEDMHLKNYALVTVEGKTKLAPAYDFINSSIVLKNAKEEIALTLNGKKRNLTRKDMVDYFALQMLKLSKTIIDEQLEKVSKAKPTWFKLLEICFLNSTLKEKYFQLINKRLEILDI